MNTTEPVNRAIEKARVLLEPRDREFFDRVWRTSRETYEERLKAIGFEGMGTVLDAGSGMAQWTFRMAALNTNVKAIDCSKVRLDIGRVLAAEWNVENVDFRQQSVESVDYPDSYFDGIFCYSVLMMADYKKAVTEFLRLLKPGGTVYIVSSGLGWYLYNVAVEQNKSNSYDPRQMAIDAIDNTITFLSTGNRDPSRQLAIPSATVKAEMELLGYSEVLMGPEGSIALDGRRPGQSFYGGEYCGVELAYEILATK